MSEADPEIEPQAGKLEEESSLPVDDVLWSVINVMRQGEELLTGLPDPDYSRRLPAAFNASIGVHYRHCLDHFRSLERAFSSRQVNYDQRDRDPALEQNRLTALGETRRLIEVFATLNPEELDRSVNAIAKVNDRSPDSQSAASTLRRELIYVVAHTVHHFAIIAVMANMMNMPQPTGFGVAPSTLEHRGFAAI